MNKQPVQILYLFIILAVVPILVSTVTQAQDTMQIPDFRVIYAASAFGNVEDNTDIFLLDTVDMMPINLTNNSAEDIFPAVSVDGTQIAFLSNRSGQYEIYVMDSDGSNVVQLTEESKPNLASVTWSADGTTIAFSSFRDANFEIYSIDIENNVLNRLTNNTVNDFEPTWSPQTHSLAFVSDGNIAIMDPDSGDTSIVYSGSGDNKDLAWSSDGNKIAFASYTLNPDETSYDAEIYIIEIETENLVQLTDNLVDDASPSWSRDGNYLTFVSNAGEAQNDFEIMLANPEDGEILSITSNLSNERCPILSSDGTVVLFVSDRGAPFETNDIYAIQLEEMVLSQITASFSNERCPLSWG
jgi:Tol biopolymer transport system component